MLKPGNDPCRLPLDLLADELGETSDAVRAAALVREMTRRGRDRASGRRYAVWVAGKDLVILDRVAVAAVVGEGPAPTPPPA
jgi:hypothetical protein